MRNVTANPFIGVTLHWIGGLAAASFYIPFKRVKKWSWETYWLVGGIFSWVIAPHLLAWALVPNVAGIFHEVPAGSIGWAYFFGVLWGIGGLTFGLSVRYLGVALGYAVALGMCAIFGTLIPPIFHGQIGKMTADRGGQVTLLGIAVCMVGIIFSAMAGMSKERELGKSRQPATMEEFGFLKGMLVALFAGILSAAMAFGLDAGAPIAKAAEQHLLAAGRSNIWQGLPVLIIVLLGGFTTNFIWCAILNLKNKTGHEYVSNRAGDVPMLSNYLFAALAGVTWYFPILLLHHGLDANGPVRLLQLDPPHGQHHHLQHTLGRGPERMAWDQQKDTRADRRGIGRINPVNGDRRIRQLLEGVRSLTALCIGHPAAIISPGWR
jgi:L-rhamnose-H+ transport protein